MYEQNLLAAFYQSNKTHQTKRLATKSILHFSTISERYGPMFRVPNGCKSTPHQSNRAAPPKFYDATTINTQSTLTI